MEILVPKYRRDPNEKVESIYAGVASGGRTVTSVVKPSQDRNRMEATRTYGAGMQPGQGGRVGILVLGGMETTLAEMEYIVEAKRQQKFVPRRSSSEIAQMCRLVLERRNEQIRAMRKNRPERPKKQQVRFHLPVGYRYAKTSEPGLRVLARV